MRACVPGGAGRILAACDAYIWGFVNGRPILNTLAQRAELPTRTSHSDAVSKDLARRGFKSVGTTICYAFMRSHRSGQRSREKPALLYGRKLPRADSPRLWIRNA